MIHKDLLKSIREFTEKNHGKSPEKIVMREDIANTMTHELDAKQDIFGDPEKKKLGTTMKFDGIPMKVVDIIPFEWMIEATIGHVIVRTVKFPPHPINVDLFNINFDF